MFNESFYPTPLNVINQMLYGEDIANKVILEPSAGKGDIVDECFTQGAKDVIACEINQDLKTILKSKCHIIADDFLQVTSEKISHIDYIVMNPPFANADEHILHAWNIAPSGCKIIAICNQETLRNIYSSRRQQLYSIIEVNGSSSELGNCFADGERRTGVYVSLVKLQKPGTNYKTEFDGFYMDEEPEEITGEGMMKYNAVRDLVNRYVEAVKLFDKQIELGVQMNHLTKSFYKGNICFECTEDNKVKTRHQFKKDLQADGWKHIFEQMNMNKYSTRGLKEDINKFINQQTEIPFTMKNIYRMFEIVIGTAGQRMDKALEEVFNKLTEHHHENRYNVEGWKTNSHYLVNRKFIMPYMCEADKWNKDNRIQTGYGRNNFEIIEDLVKVLCYITNDNYDSIKDLRGFISNYRDAKSTYPKYGEILEWSYFKIKAFKKGTMHFEFKDEDLWGKFNQHISRIKGYPLFETKSQTTWQKRQAGRQEPLFTL